MPGESKLYYLVGASGSGKDSILAMLKQEYDLEKALLKIARRCITREASEKNNSTEDFVSLTVTDFKQKLEQNQFALHWYANGCYYGIHNEIDDWLGSGYSVIVNGSREYLPQAKSLYPETLYTIGISVDEQVIMTRLEQRQRESVQQIQERINRHRQLTLETEVDAIIENNGLLETAVANIYQRITG